MGSLLISLVILSSEPALQRALEAAVAVPHARVELLNWKGPSCRGAYEVTRIDSSGRVPVRVRGARCDEWGWATIRVLAQAAIVTDEVRTGATLDGHWALRELEVRHGMPTLTDIPTGTTASRLLRTGECLTPQVIRVGPPPGSPVTVRVVTGGIIIEQTGVTMPCAPGRVCATLPNGRRLIGRWEQGAIIVDPNEQGGRL